MSKQTPGVRYAEIEHESSQSRVRVVVDLDSTARQKPAVDTGIGMFDYLISIFAKEAKIELGVSAEGDLGIDDQHTVRDVGACIGKAIRHAIGEADGIKGNGSCVIPVEEALMLTAIVFAGNSVLKTNIQFSNERLGGLSTECIEEFFRNVVVHSGMTVHIKQLDGTNNHHIAEAAFKSFGVALNSALQRTE